MSDIGFKEKDAALDRMRESLKQRGCVMYRQWGGNPACAILLPANGGPQRVVVKGYAEFSSRAEARAAVIRAAYKALETGA